MPDLPAIFTQPLVVCGRETCGDLPAALRREWLVTNGLGGYASSSLIGVNTRRYHGLLIASLRPPVDRTALVGGAIEWATYLGRRWPLSTFEYAEEVFDPQGYRHLESFRLEGALPVWTFALGDALLERRVWMRAGANTTYVRYALLRGSDDVRLDVTPLVTYRDFHTLTSGQGWAPQVAQVADGVEIVAHEGARAFRALSPGAGYAPGGEWHWNFHHREETRRGLDDQSDLYATGAFRFALAPGETRAIVYTAEDGAPVDAERALADERARQRDLIVRARATSAHPVVQQLTLAADQFLVAREGSDGAAGRTVIAGYHWFNDWGRDTMIALPGLTLATGRADEAAAILRAFSRYVSQGMLPNNFPDSSGVPPAYNTADATLWYFVALHAYAQTTGDAALVDELAPTLRDIVGWHVRGTRFGIGVDPADGLLRAGAPGVQLTWMDAKVGDWVVTPRVGKPVEINALWYNALRMLAEFLRERDDEAAERYDAMAQTARASFQRRFSRDGSASLADVVDGPDGDDWRLRPNQLFAVSLPYPLVEGEAARGVVESAGQALLTSYGLRSLSPDDPAFIGTYKGDQRERDAAYHQGTVWGWLIGPYVEARYRVDADAGAARALLLPFAQHLLDAGLGTISEIFEGDAPFLPAGCVAQAWSVAEVLRLWRLLDPILDGARP